MLWTEATSENISSSLQIDSQIISSETFMTWNFDWKVELYMSGGADFSGILGPEVPQDFREFILQETLQAPSEQFRAKLTLLSMCSNVISVQT
jgi:hypothetical protein